MPRRNVKALPGALFATFEIVDEFKDTRVVVMGTNGSLAENMGDVRAEEYLADNGGPETARVHALRMGKIALDA